MNNFLKFPLKAYNGKMMWTAEYLNGTLFHEYDEQGTSQNDFYQINKDQLLRFGLWGYGYKFYFDVSTGIYSIIKNINNHIVIDTYQILYLDENNYQYYLTGQQFKYNDIIQYKEEEIIAPLALPQGYQFKSSIKTYNFGYKTKVNINDINFNFKTIFHFPANNKPHSIEIKVVADKKMNGCLVIRKNGFDDYKYPAPIIQANSGGRIDWTVR